MCGRFTVKATWAELMALYRLTMDAPPHNLRPRYNVCPTDPVDVVTAEEGKRELVRCVGASSRAGRAKPSKTRR
jgi:putative SOS response-associated peptidase YedK